MLNGELNVPLSQCYHNHRKYGHGGDHVDIYGKNHRCFTLKQDTIWSRRPWCRCWFSCTTTLLFYVIYQSFYIANQKLTWLILMKAFNILSNLLQYSISFPTIAAVSVDRISRDLSTLTLPGTCHHSSYCPSLRYSEALGLILTCCTVDHRILHGNYWDRKSVV